MTPVPHPYWPLFDLRVRTPRLELRLPTDDELVELVRITDEQGVHDPDTMPFTIPWTDRPTPHRQRESMQFFWRCRADWSPFNWNFNGAVFVDGCPVGVQGLGAAHFKVLRSVNTGSWLGRGSQGQGLGKEMRAAILHLAFAGLGAREARSGAFADNASSAATSRSLGYQDDGTEVARRRDAPGMVQRFLLTREQWEARRRDDITIEGLEGCLDMFGADRGWRRRWSRALGRQAMGPDALVDAEATLHPLLLRAEVRRCFGHGDDLRSIDLEGASVAHDGRVPARDDVPHPVAVLAIGKRDEHVVPVLDRHDRRVVRAARSTPDMTDDRGVRA